MLLSALPHPLYSTLGIKLAQAAQPTRLGHCPPLECWEHSLSSLNGASPSSTLGARISFDKIFDSVSQWCRPRLVLLPVTIFDSSHHLIVHHLIVFALLSSSPCSTPPLLLYMADCLHSHFSSKPLYCEVSPRVFIGSSTALRHSFRPSSCRDRLNGIESAIILLTAAAVICTQRVLASAFELRAS